jgi:nucleoside-diphosphate-sugar epimerase
VARRVAVTGGRGFIGARLITRLVAEGIEVRVLGRRKPPERAAGVEFIEGDLTLPHGDLIRFLDGMDVVYHCAAEIRDESRMRAVNVLGTKRLIDAARGRVGRWVQLSSVGAYGPVSEGVVTEDQSEAPDGEYECTKTEADKLIRAAVAEGAFPAVLLRPSNVYGPTMRNRSLFQLIRAIDRGMFFFIGRPGASANYIHVDNVVEALVRSATASSLRQNASVYIVSDHRSLEEFVGTIAAHLGHSVPRTRIPAWLARGVAYGAGWIPGFPLTTSRIHVLTNRAVYSTRRIEADLGYAPVISMEEGLRQMVEVTRAEVRHAG